MSTPKKTQQTSALEQLIAQKLKEKGQEPTRAEAKAAVRKNMGALEDLDVEEREKSKRAPKRSRKNDRFAPIERSNGQLYYPRMIEGTDKTDVEMLREACEHTNVDVVLERKELYALLGGAPGCGKTSCVEAAFGETLLTIEGNGEMETTAILGRYIPDPDVPGAFIWIDGPLVRAMKEGRPLLIDDATLIPANVISVVYPAMDGRRKITLDEHLGEEVVAEKGFYIAMAHNPGAPGAILADAMNSRCRLQFDVPTDLELCVKLGISRKLKGVAAKLHNLRNNDNTDLTWAPELRELIAFRDLEDLYGSEVAARNMIAQVKDDDDRQAVVKLLAEAYGQGLEPLAFGSSKLR